MATPKEIDFAVGTVVPDTWLDKIQEVEAGLLWNFALTYSATVVSWPASFGNDAACINIGGQFRYVEGTINVTVSGAADTYGIFAAIQGGDASPAFSLMAVKGVSATPNVTYYRKLANVTWSGTAITDMSYTTGYTKHGFMHGALDPIPTVSIDFSMLTPATQARLVPTGSLMPFAGATAPSGWLLCYGQAVSRSTYVDLYAVVGSTYGAGDGSTTFNLPDLRGRVGVGLDNMGGSDAGRLSVANTIGTTGGEEKHTLTTAEMPAHNHSGSTNSTGAHTHTGLTSSAGAHTHTGSTSAVADHSHGGSVATGGVDHTHGYNQSNDSNWGVPGGTPTAYLNKGLVWVGSGGATAYLHSHGISADGGHSHTISSDGAHQHTISSDGAHSHTISSDGSGTAHNVMQPYQLISYIVKT